MWHKVSSLLARLKYSVTYICIWGILCYFGHWLAFSTFYTLLLNVSLSILPIQSFYHTIHKVDPALSLLYLSTRRFLFFPSLFNVVMYRVQRFVTTKRTMVTLIEECCRKQLWENRSSFDFSKQTGGIFLHWRRPIWKKFVSFFLLVYDNWKLKWHICWHAFAIDLSISI